MELAVDWFRDVDWTNLPRIPYAVYTMVKEFEDYQVHEVFLQKFDESERVALQVTMYYHNLDNFSHCSFHVFDGEEPEIFTKSWWLTKTTLRWCLYFI
jgi:hypothetical protein